MNDWWKEGRQTARQAQPTSTVSTDDEPIMSDTELERWARDYRQAGFRPEEIARIIYYVNRADQEMGNIAKPGRKTVTINYGAPIKNFHSSLVRWGFKFRVDGDKLRVTAPDDVEVSPVVWEEIRKRKPQLIVLLKDELGDGKQGDLLVGSNISPARSKERG